jgi:outer membrane protein TolC
LGSQGFEWKVNNKTPYYFLGVSLELNLFSFGKNKLKAQQAGKDLQIIRSQQDQIADQLNLQLAVAQNNYRSALEQYKSAKSREETTAKVYKDMQKMYQAGQAIFIELLDAQNQYITAQNQRNIALTDIWLKWVEVERANASYNL